MYFPYFYAKRAERNALIDVVTHLGSPQKVHPILEPYSPAEDLAKLLNAFSAAKQRLHLVVNPSRGLLQTAPSRAAWSAAMASPIAQPALITPTLHVLAGSTEADLIAFLAAFPKRDVALIVLDPGLAPAIVAKHVVGKPVRVFTGPRVAVTDYQTALSPLPVVALTPRFPVMTNADYPGTSPFSLNPTSYGTTGFGDFALLDPKLPRVGAGGGGGAGAVALHLTYQDATTNELHVQHFLSDDRVQGAPPVAIKLLQAIGHMDAQQTATPGRFLQSPGFQTLHKYRVDKKETSLEKSKQQQISHHLFTVASAL
ncbi:MULTISPECIES: sce7725 family protein [unclassified Curtobacterium]|uniref:sce7725 family protein n=1 Tax=unclassified Curtobacterium TaxID=257496 RepID=UPI0015871D8E|nr:MULTISPECIES: sce7725 family protein [unclassified Curtobacterium]